MIPKVISLTAHERRILEKSWVKPFAEKIFPLINEEIFFRPLQ